MQSETRVIPFSITLGARIADVTKLIEPTSEIEESDFVLDKELDDYLKRFLTLNIEMTHEYAEKLRYVYKAIDRALKPEYFGLLGMLRSIYQENPEKARLAKELETLGTELMSLALDVQSAHAMFFHELRRRHPELLDKPVLGVKKGWKIFWRQKVTLEDLSRADVSEITTAQAAIEAAVEALTYIR